MRSVIQTSRPRTNFVGKATVQARKPAPCALLVGLTGSGVQIALARGARLAGRTAGVRGPAC